jgi:hypothetical protein
MLLQLGNASGWSPRNRSLDFDCTDILCGCKLPCSFITSSGVVSMNEPLSDANHATAKRAGIAASILNCFLYCRLTVLLVFNYLCFRDSFYNGKGLFDW